MRPGKDKPWVVFWNNVPSHYMVQRFDALAVRGNVDFEAWFNGGIFPGGNRPAGESSWRFKYRYIPTITLAGLSFGVPFPLLYGRAPDVLASLIAEPVFVLGWQLARLRKVRTAIRVLKTFDSWIRRRAWKNALKRYIFGRTDGILTFGEDSKAFALECGAPADRIYRLPQAIDVEHFRKNSLAIQSRRNEMRRELGLRGFVFIYVGRLHGEKGLGTLLEAFSGLQESLGDSISLLLVGDGPERAELQRKCEEGKIRNVVFAGAKTQQELPAYYGIADAFVFPTLGDPYGLVVDEAMACSLPIVSTNTAGEIGARVEHGVNGFIVKSGDAAEMRRAMESMVMDPDMCRRMGQDSAQRVSGRTPDLWAVAFEQAVFSMLARPRA